MEIGGFDGLTSVSGVTKSLIRAVVGGLISNFVLKSGPFCCRDVIQSFQYLSHTLGTLSDLLTTNGTTCI